MEIALSIAPNAPRHEEFNLQTHFVTDMLQQKLEAWRYKKVQKIAIRLMPDTPKAELLDNTNVLLINHKYDATVILDAPVEQKARLMLKVIFDALMKVFGKDKSVAPSLLRVYHDALALNGRNEYYLSPMLYAPDKQHAGAILCRHTIDSFNMYAQLFDATGFLIGEKQLVSCLPYWYAYSEELGDTKWDNGIVLYNADGDKSRSFLLSEC